MYNLDGSFNTEFNSITECAKYLNKKIADISRNCKTGSIVNKQYYISTHKYEVFPIPQNNLERPVYQYDIYGNFIKLFKNVKEAKK